MRKLLEAQQAGGADAGGRDRNGDYLRSAVDNEIASTEFDQNPGEVFEVSAETLTVDVRLTSGAWRGTEMRDVLERCLQAITGIKKIGEQGPRGRPQHASLLLADDSALRDLNRTYRKKDRATNVLAFPSGEGPEGGFLGDLAIAYETTLTEARAAGIDFYDHAAHLFVHGLLHLLGYDHVSDADAARMESLEILALKSMGISNPYGEG